MSKKLLLILLLIVIAAGLGVWKVTESLMKAGRLGDEAVAAFHVRFNAAQEAEILKESAPAFQQSVVLATLQKTNDDFRKQLGKFVSGSRTGIHLKTNNGDTSLHLSYEADYEKGKVKETFVFDYNGEKPLLYNYVLNSPALEMPVNPPAPTSAPATTPALEK